MEWDEWNGMGWNLGGVEWDGMEFGRCGMGWTEEGDGMGPVLFLRPLNPVLHKFPNL